MRGVGFFEQGTYLICSEKGLRKAHLLRSGVFESPPWHPPCLHLRNGGRSGTLGMALMVAAIDFNKDCELQGTVTSLHLFHVFR